MYSRHITYGTASEFGFDYLRDNGMATCKEDQVQTDYYFCIIDEADSILVDEARTPLIISGPMREDRPLPFMEMKPLVVKLFDTQIRECNNLVSEAKRALEDENISEEDADEHIARLYKVKKGMPSNKHLLRMMEVAHIRKKFEKFDLEMNSDYNKERAHSLKEELFYIIDEKTSSPTSRKRTQPNQPDGPQRIRNTGFGYPLCRNRPRFRCRRRRKTTAKRRD